MNLLNSRTFLIAAVMAISALTSACGTLSGDVALSVVGVNYTESEYSMIVRDPNDRDNSGVTGELTPYSAGGQMCCFSLPPKWRPDLTVEVTSLRAVIENDKYVGDDLTVTHVPVPKYEAEQMGTFWILQFDDRVEVLNSMYSPGHPNWEGAVKSMPIPSLVYRKKVWNVYYQEALRDLQYFEAQVKKGASNPHEQALRTWNWWKRDHPTEISGFSGPNDPAFIEKALAHDRAVLETTQKKVAELKRREPK